MPSLSQTPHLSNPPKANDEASAWIRDFVRNFGRLWTMLVHVVNTSCRVDTLANRTSTPDLDESFFVASNTSQLFAGVSGAWANVGPRRGTATVLNGGTSVTVSLSPAENAATYIIAVAPSHNTTTWITGRTTTQFVVNVGTAPGADASVFWTLWRA